MGQGDQNGQHFGGLTEVLRDAEICTGHHGRRDCLAHRPGHQPGDAEPVEIHDVLLVGHLPRTGMGLIAMAEAINGMERWVKLNDD